MRGLQCRQGRVGAEDGDPRAICAVVPLWSNGPLRTYRSRRSGCASRPLGAGIPGAARIAHRPCRTGWTQWTSRPRCSNWPLRTYCAHGTRSSGLAYWTLCSRSPCRANRALRPSATRLPGKALGSRCSICAGCTRLARRALRSCGTCLTCRPLWSRATAGAGRPCWSNGSGGALDVAHILPSADDIRPHVQAAADQVGISGIARLRQLERVHQRAQNGYAGACCTCGTLRTRWTGRACIALWACCARWTRWSYRSVVTLGTRRTLRTGGAASGLGSEQRIGYAQHPRGAHLITVQTRTHEKRPGGPIDRGETSAGDHTGPKHHVQQTEVVARDNMLLLIDHWAFGTAFYDREAQGGRRVRLYGATYITKDRLVVDPVRCLCETADREKAGQH